jgi:hypothetical protein
VTPARALKVRYLVRFDELIDRGAQMAQRFEVVEELSTYPPHVEEQHSPGMPPKLEWIAWVANATTLMLAVLPKDHVQTVKVAEMAGWRQVNANLHSAVLAVLQAVRSDFDFGFFDRAELLIRAEVASDELEQAELLAKAGYYAPAAVVAGVVLETSLRKLADANGIALLNPNGSRRPIDPLNIELAKTGMYNPTKQKDITAWAGLRNDAAHGNWSNVKPADVDRMISGVRTFVGDYLR